MECLIVIDMQNEFLLDTGNFSKNHVDNNILIKNVVNLINTFQDKPVIFIKSEYESNLTGVPQDKFVVGTHIGKKPCCKKDTVGALIHSEILETFKENKDIIILKHWFSAFRDTNLHEILKEKQITKIYFAGLKTNVCVKFTIMDAIKHGYDIEIIDNCVSTTSIKTHLETIENIQGMINLDK